MATVQYSVARGANLDASAGGNITEATGGAGPTGIVDVNIATGMTKEEILRALTIVKDKVINSVNMP